MNTPIKRHTSLIPLSIQHHHSLLLCWKIRTGYKKSIQVNRIQHYAEWFYKNHLMPHFEVEEKYVFPILGVEHELVKRALTEHRRLKRLFQGINQENKNLGLIEEELESHIRFEERVLFNEIQRVASPVQFEEVMAKHADHTSGVGKVKEWEDEFWS